MLCTASMFSQKRHTPSGNAEQARIRPAISLAAENQGCVASLECVRAKTRPSCVMQQLPPSSFSVTTTSESSVMRVRAPAEGAWSVTSSSVAPGEKCTWGVRGYCAGRLEGAATLACAGLPSGACSPPSACAGSTAQLLVGAAVQTASGVASKGLGVSWTIVGAALLTVLGAALPVSGAAPTVSGAAAQRFHRSEQNLETKRRWSSVSILPGLIARSTATASSAPIAGVPSQLMPSVKPCLTSQHAMTVPALPLPPPQCTRNLPPRAASASMAFIRLWAWLRVGGLVLGTGQKRFERGGCLSAANHDASRGSSSVSVTTSVMPSASRRATTCSKLFGVDAPNRQFATTQLVFRIRATLPRVVETHDRSLGLVRTVSGSHEQLCFSSVPSPFSASPSTISSFSSSLAIWRFMRLAHSPRARSHLPARAPSAPLAMHAWNEAFASSHRSSPNRH
mmetsp:Transcript_920/g.2005  ORF Transcript_920/g.2005 Transcript_920/m.2005 type:complete len:452 (+) Transcript_920:1302-2657(+)